MKSQLLRKFLRTSLVRNFIQIGGKCRNVFYSRKYGFHRTDFHETHDSWRRYVDIFTRIRKAMYKVRVQIYLRPSVKYDYAE
jgi:hypothetical protein